MRRLYQVLGVLVLAGFSSGCAFGLKGSVPFQYTPSLPSGVTLPWHSAMQRVEVAIPPADQRATAGVGDISEKLTVKLLEDFRVSQVFRQLSFPTPAEGVDLILKPLLQRFYWKFKMRGTVFVPFFSLFLDTYEMKGIAQLRMELVRPSDGDVLASYEKSSTKTLLFGIRNMRAGDLGAELGDALREVTKQIKDAMAADQAVLASRLESLPTAAVSSQPAGNETAIQKEEPSK